MSETQASVRVADGQFRIDGEAVQLISGVVHYFRIPRGCWRDRLEKAVDCGLNAVESYLCWNLHEPERGRFDFSGMLDFEAFVRLAQELGLYVILRPGPYICSEWDNGGIPVWLLTEPGLRVRRSNPAWQRAVAVYMAEILPRIHRLEYAQGGPVIALQLENEYGSYAQDHAYMTWLRDLFQRYCDSVLFTMDGAEAPMVSGGSTPGVWRTLSFGARGVENFRRFPAGDGPDCCMEFWHGWFDHWGELHHTRDPEDAARELDAMLAMGASVNLYSFAGGTNFGFHNGANGLPGEAYASTTTGYDFDAPVSESGDLTVKYFRYREVIRKYRPQAPALAVGNPKKIAYPAVRFSGSAPLLEQLDRLGSVFHAIDPEPMEYFHQAFGFIHYRTRLEGPATAALNFYELHDRAQVFLDGGYLATLDRNRQPARIETVAIPADGAVLEVLVENQGRINYGPLLARDFKGLTGGVALNNQLQTNWEIRPLPLDDLTGLVFGDFGFRPEYPAFHRAEFEIAEAADSFIRFPGEKGVIWVNGFNLGRYWSIGPGKNLFLPAEYLQVGHNTVVVLELHRLHSGILQFSGLPERE